MARELTWYCSVCERPVALRRRGRTYRIGGAEILDYGAESARVRCTCGTVSEWLYPGTDRPTPP